MPRLRRVARMCSRTVSGTAYRFRHGSTLCSPTVEKILCRSPFRSGHMSAICARLSQKEVGVKRVETLVSTLLPRRGARHVPAVRRRRIFSLNLSEKPPARKETNTLTQFEYPAQPVLKKSCRPSGANPPAAVRVPQLVSAGNIYKKSCCTHAAALSSVNLNRTGSKPKFPRRYARLPR